MFFFFQAEDGIRDKLVTGVQTCALPIYETLAAGTVIRASLQHALSTENNVAGDAFTKKGVDEANGRAACRGRGEISGGAALFKKKKKNNAQAITRSQQFYNMQIADNSNL